MFKKLIEDFFSCLFVLFHFFQVKHFENTGSFPYCIDFSLMRSLFSPFSPHVVFILLCIKENNMGRLTGLTSLECETQSFCFLL